jgi:NodT family efflux transporter outer membrane factor (OMF) lipoprotein
MRLPCTYALAVAALSAGCTVGPDYQRPEVRLFPVDHKYAAEYAALPTQAVWWERFDDPVLSDLVSSALRQNLSLDQASAQLAQARAGRGLASAALLPSGNLSASAGRAYQSTETQLGQVLDAMPDYERHGNAYETNLEAGWEIDLFGGLRRDRQAALADYQASHAALAATRLAVAAQTADLYLIIRGLQARLAIARQRIAVQTQLLEKTRLMHAKGVSAEFELRQADGELAQVQASVPPLETGLEAAQNALDVMLGTPAGSHRSAWVAPRGIPATPRFTATGLPADLLRRRPDLRVAERRLAASTARIGVAISEYYPKFSLGALVGSATTVSGGHLLSSGANQWAGVLGLRWRLFDFARIDAQIDAAKGREAEALALYRQSALRATEDVENAFSALAHRQEELDVLSRGEDALNTARASSFEAYRKGAASLVNVLRADERILQTSDARARAQTESARAAVAAFKALGGGWQAADSSDDIGGHPRAISLLSPPTTDWPPPLPAAPPAR